MIKRPVDCPPMVIEQGEDFVVQDWWQVLRKHANKWWAYTDAERHVTNVTRETLLTISALARNPF